MSDEKAMSPTVTLDRADVEQIVNDLQAKWARDMGMAPFLFGILEKLEAALAQSATPAPAAPDARVDDTLSKLRSAINDLRNYDQIGAVSRQYFAYYLELWLDAARQPPEEPRPAPAADARADNRTMHAYPVDTHSD